HLCSCNTFHSCSPRPPGVRPGDESPGGAPPNRSAGKACRNLTNNPKKATQMSRNSRHVHRDLAVRTRSCAYACYAGQLTSQSALGCDYCIIMYIASLEAPVRGLAVSSTAQRNLFGEVEAPPVPATDLYAEVVFDRPLDHAYTYAVPEELH